MILRREFAPDLPLHPNRGLGFESAGAALEADDVHELLQVSLAADARILRDLVDVLQFVSDRH